jgi:hypothetical protein
MAPAVCLDERGSLILCWAANMAVKGSEDGGRGKAVAGATERVCRFDEE